MQRGGKPLYRTNQQIAASAVQGVVEVPAKFVSFSNHGSGLPCGSVIFGPVMVSLSRPGLADSAGGGWSQNIIAFEAKIRLSLFGAE
jgi:hypothetical protein